MITEYIKAHPELSNITVRVSNTFNTLNTVTLNHPNGTNKIVILTDLEISDGINLSEFSVSYFSDPEGTKFSKTKILEQKSELSLNEINKLKQELLKLKENSLRFESKKFSTLFYNY